MKWHEMEGGEMEFNEKEWNEIKLLLNVIQWGDGLRENYEMRLNAIQWNFIKWNELKVWNGMK